MKMLQILKLAEGYGVGLTLEEIQEVRRIKDKEERRNVVCMMIEDNLY